MAIGIKILKNKPKLNSNGQYRFDVDGAVETNLSISGDFNSKFLDDDLYTINLKNQINDDILKNTWDLYQETDLKLSVKVRNAGVSGDVKSIKFKVSLFDDGHPDFVQGYPFLSDDYNSAGGYCEGDVDTGDVDSDGNTIFGPGPVTCTDTMWYNHYKNISQNNDYKIYDKSYDQQSDNWNPEPLINDSLILSNFWDDTATTEYNDDFSSNSYGGYKIENLKYETSDYVDIGHGDTNNFYVVVYMQGHKDLLIGTDRRDSRIQVFRFRKRDFKFELDDAGVVQSCFSSDPSTDLNCEEDSSSSGTYHQKRTSSYLINKSYNNSSRYQGQEGGGYGAESPAFKCTQVKMEITQPYATLDETRIPNEYKNTLKFPKSLNSDSYERFFELSPERLINFSNLDGSDMSIDFYAISGVTTSTKDLQQYYHDNDEKFTTSAPGIINFNFSVENINRTPIDNDDLGFAYFIIDWNDDNKKYQKWEDVLSNIPQTYSELYIKQQQDNLFILRGVNQGGNFSDFSEIGTLEHFYRTSGLKTIKSVILSYGKDASGRIQSIRWKLVTTRIYLNENRVTKEDFSELGTLGFTTIPWPQTSPIISGISKLSKYYDSVENVLYNNRFADDELLSETTVYNALINDELGDYVGDVDIEQTRFFKGARDMDQLLMIESVAYNPYDNYEHWDGENNFYPDFDESCVGLIFISDSSNTALKQNCLIELNMGDIENGDNIIDTSGNKNMGILIGDYSITKESTLVPLTRDSNMKLPEIDNEDKAI